MKRVNSRVGAYGVAMVAVSVGIALPMVTKPFVGQSAPWISFIPAVLLSAWYGGFIPGVITSLMLVVVGLTMSNTLFTSNQSPATRVFGAFMFMVAAMTVCLVIRALRKAQAAVQAERDRLELILRDLPVGVLIATEEGRVELANPAAIEIYGGAIRPGETGPKTWPLERSLKSGETIVNEEIDIVRPDGSARALMINSRPLGDSAAIATYSDVTSLRAAQRALRDSEARLRRLFDSPLIGVVSGDGDVAIEANDGFLRMLGYSREDLRNGGISFSALTPDEFHAADARVTVQLEERGFSAAVVKELIAVDGRRVPVMVGVTSFEPGQSSPWIAWVLDLSEHRKLEERLRQAAKAESIGLLAGGVAHDFNNLLTIIIGNASMAQMMLKEDSPGRAQIEDALRAAERAADLTRQLLAYAGKGRFVVRQADVSAAIRDIGKLFRASARAEVDIRLELAQGLPMVRADVTQLQQLVMNLVINAVESIGENRRGTVRVATSAVVVDEEFLQSAYPVEEMAPGRYVLIEVTDDGCGMDAETRARIFDPFFTTKFTGRGLGLAAAAGIVRAHQGGMMVHSVPEQGSSFRVFLPAAGAPVSEGWPVEDAAGVSVVG
jgi:two-component system, cell cycle sensor histidine kinase and response regulator CckA